MITQSVAPQEPSEFEDDNSFCIDVIQAVCNCFKGRDTTSELAKAVVKALVFIVTCSPVPVHGDPLLLCFETCMLIFLQSKHSSGQVAAKVALIQMTNDICQRLEVCKFETARRSKWKSICDEHSLNTSLEENSVPDSVDVVENWTSNPFGEEDVNVLNTEEEGPGIEDEDENSNNEINSVVEVCNAVQVVSGSFQRPAVRRFDSLDSFVHEGVFTLMEKDVIIIFKYFCKLCSAPTPNYSYSNKREDSAIRVKTQSLHLILIVLDVLSPTLQHNEEFIALVKDYLCNAALMACAVPSRHIFKLCGAILSELLYTFKGCLLEEYLFLIEELYLKPMMEPSTPPEFTAEILSHLFTLFGDSETVMILSVPFSGNGKIGLMELISAICKLVKGTNLNRNKISCVQCLNAILNSLDSWYSNQLHDLNKYITGYIEKREVFPVCHGDSIAEIEGCVSNLNMKSVTFLEAMRKILPSLIKTSDLKDFDVRIKTFSSLASNIEQFKCADDVYYATYATIALNLSAHGYYKHDYSRLLSKSEFVKDLKHNCLYNMSEEYFSGLYDTIVAVDILGIMGTGSQDVSSSLSNSICVMGYGMKELLTKKAPFQFKSVYRKGFPDREGGKYRGSQLDIIKMYDFIELCWRPIYVALNVTFENAHEQSILSQCQEGFKRMIRLSAIVGHDLALDSFISGLASFSKVSIPAIPQATGQLTTSDPHDHFHQKHWSALNCLISIGCEYGTYLNSNWAQIFSCISHLENQKKFIGDDDALAFNYKTVSLDIEQMFQDSQNFSFEMLFSFCNELSSVATEELNMKDPKFFCVRRLVDILCENMHRIHLEWRCIWNSVGTFFGSVGNHHNNAVSSVIIDSLHLIVSQYFERQELPGFHFHEKMVKPYESIIATGSRRSDIKNRIVNCIHLVSEEHAINLKTAWKGIFNVLTKCNKRKIRFSDEGNSPVFNVIEQILSKGECVFRDCVVHCVKCILTFMRPSFGKESGEFAICLLQVCLDKLSELQPKQKWAHSHLQFTSLVDGIELDCDLLESDPFSWIKAWYIVIRMIVPALRLCHHSVQASVLNLLVTSLKTNCHLFRPSFSNTLVEDILLPVLRDICDSREGKWQKNIRFASICVVDLFCDLFFDDISSETLDALLLQLSDNILLNDEIVARSGTSCLKHLISRNGKAFTEGIWAKICRLIYDIFMETMPDGLCDIPAVTDHCIRKSDSMVRLIQHIFVIEEDGMTEVHFPVMDFKKGLRKRYSSYAPKEDSELGLTVVEDFFNDMCVKLVIQLLLIQIADDILADDDKVARMSETNFHILMQALKKSYSFANMFNKSNEIRSLLKKKLGTKRLPNLLRQETTCASTYLRVLFSVYSMSSRSDLQNVYEVEIEDVCTHVCSTFVNTLANDEVHENAVWRPVMMTLLNSTLKLDREHVSYGLMSLRMVAPSV